MTISRFLRRAALVAVGVFAVSASAAQAQGMPQSIPLTPQSVEGVIASYPGVRAAADALQAQYGDVGDDDGDVASAFSAWAAVSDAQGQLNAAVQPHGFPDYMTWVQTLSSVAIAYAYVREGGNMDDQTSQAVQAIQNNPNLSAAQKEMMMQQMQAMMGAIDSMRPPQGNLDAVSPYVGQLQQLFEDT